MGAHPGRDYGEPLAVALHNTRYVVRGEPSDALADAEGLRAWLAVIGGQLPTDTGAVGVDRLEDFVSLRVAVREGLHAALEGRSMSEAALGRLNDASASNPASVRLSQNGHDYDRAVRYHAPTPADLVLGVLASSAIELVTGPSSSALRACGAPGCVLMFLKDHPRREWCSTACGNRARQARFHARRRQRELRD